MSDRLWMRYAGATRRHAILAAVVLSAAALLSAGLGLAQRRSTLDTLSPDQMELLADLDTLWARAEREESFRRTDAELGRLEPTDASRYAYELLARRGARSAALGLAREAEPFLRRALALAEALGDPKAQCTALRWLGVAEDVQGRKTEARVLYTRLLDLALRTHDPGSEAWARYGLGSLNSEQGRLRDAEDETARSVEIFRETGSLRSEMQALVSLGNILAELGELDEALRCHQRVEAASRERGWVGLEASASHDIACILWSIGDPGEAERRFVRARELFAADGNLRDAIIAGNNQALCAITLQRADGAVRLLEELESGCRREGVLELVPMLQNTMAEARWRQRRHEASARLYRSTLATGSLVPVDDKVEALLGLSHQLAAMDSSRAAVALLREWLPWARALEDRSQSARFLTEAGRRLLDAGEAGAASELLAEAEREGVRLARTDLRWEALVPAMKAARELGKPDSALALAARAVACWESERSLPRDPEWRAARGALIGELYGQLGALLLSYPDSVSERRRAERAFDALQDFKARTLRERLHGPGPVDSAAASPAVTFARLQKEVLAPDELLLDFYLSPDTSILFAVTPTECRTATLPGALELEPRLRRFHRVLSSPAQIGGAATSPGEWQRALEGTASELYQLLFGSVADLLGGARSVVVITDGELNLLPLSLLLSPPVEAGTEDQRGDRPAGARSIQIVPSASVLAELRGDLRQPRPPGGGSGAILAVAGSRARTGQVLSGARREVEDLRRRFRHVTVGLPSADSLADRLAPYEVLHFAAHSTADDQYPWRSAIHLGSRRGDSAGGEAEIRVMASEIAELKLAARLAFLSSCQSAGGKVLTGEGVQGLAGAFLGAGVPAVLATLWEVDDRTTARLVRDFYRRIQAGRTVAQALTEAQGTLRNRPETAHPYFWAGFVLIGDGSVGLDLQPRGRTAASALPWAIAVAGILGLGIPILVRTRRPRNL